MVHGNCKTLETDSTHLIHSLPKFGERGGKHKLQTPWREIERRADRWKIRRNRPGSNEHSIASLNFIYINGSVNRNGTLQHMLPVYRCTRNLHSCINNRSCAQLFDVVVYDRQAAPLFPHLAVPFFIPRRQKAIFMEQLRLSSVTHRSSILRALIARFFSDIANAFIMLRFLMAEILIRVMEEPLWVNDNASTINLEVRITFPGSCQRDIHILKITLSAASSIH